MATLNCVANLTDKIPGDDRCAEKIWEADMPHGGGCI